jgi:hypothetical protein
MAIDILSIPAMSDEPERIFSRLGLMITKRRNHLEQSDNTSYAVLVTPGTKQRSLILASKIKCAVMYLAIIEFDRMLAPQVSKISEVAVPPKSHSRSELVIQSNPGASSGSADPSIYFAHCTFHLVAQEYNRYRAYNLWDSVVLFREHKYVLWPIVLTYGHVVKIFVIARELFDGAA